MSSQLEQGISRRHALELIGAVALGGLAGKAYYDALTSPRASQVPSEARVNFSESQELSGFPIVKALADRFIRQDQAPYFWDNLLSDPEKTFFEYTGSSSMDKNGTYKRHLNADFYKDGNQQANPSAMVSISDILEPGSREFKKRNVYFMVNMAEAYPELFTTGEQDPTVLDALKHEVEQNFVEQPNSPSLWYPVHDRIAYRSFTLDSGEVMTQSATIWKWGSDENMFPSITFEITYDIPSYPADQETLDRVQDHLASQNS